MADGWYLWRLSQASRAASSTTAKILYAFAARLTTAGRPTEVGLPARRPVMLGHATLEMGKKTLALANENLQKNHRIASPVDHWRL